MPKHLNPEELAAGLPHVLASPSDGGKIEMIVVRPGENERKELEEGWLDATNGLEGDNWKVRGSSKTPDGSAHPGKQLTLMNARCAALLAGSRDRWPLAGDQLYVDLDLSEVNLPPGSRLRLGEALIEISPLPHNGCKKFAERFGVEAVRFVNSPDGKANHLRGLNAIILEPGRIRVGDILQKVHS